MECFAQAKTADITYDTYGEKSPKTIKILAEAARCRADELKRAPLAITKLKEDLASNPKATDALKEFYTYWRASLENIGSPKTYQPFLDEMRRKAEIIRTEAAW
jgi:hypothetical protein